MIYRVCIKEPLTNIIGYVDYDNLDKAISVMNALINAGENAYIEKLSK